MATNPTPPPRIRIPFRPARVDRALGERIDIAEQRALLERVGVTTEPASAGDAVPIIAGSPPVPLTPEEAASALVATVPPHRRDLHIEADLVDCMVALPGQLFYSTQIPVCLWFLARSKKNGRFRDRRGQTLFIDARKLGKLIDRVHRELTDEEIQRLSDTYHAWRGDTKAVGRGSPDPAQKSGAGRRSPDTAQKVARSETGHNRE